MIREENIIIIEWRSDVVNMKGNDISNRCAPTIAFRVEDFVVKYRDDTFSDKVFNLFLGKNRRAYIDPNVRSAIDYIFRHTDMTAELIIERDSCFYNSKILDLLQELPCSRIITILKPVEIAVLLNIGDITYYVDDNEERRNIIGNKYCISLFDLNVLIRGR